MRLNDLGNTETEQTDLKVRSVFLNYGFAEEAYHGTLLLSAPDGFAEPREALEHLQETLWAAFNTAVKELRLSCPEDATPEELDNEFEEFLVRLMASKMDTTPGSYDTWSQIEDCGWLYPGAIEGGLMVEVLDSAEHYFKNKSNLDGLIDRWEYAREQGYLHMDKWATPMNVYVTTVARLV